MSFLDFLYKKEETPPALINEPIVQKQETIDQKSMTITTFQQNENEIDEKSMTMTQRICGITRPTIGTPGEMYTDYTSTEQYREWIYIAASTNARSVAESEIKLYSKKKPKVSVGKSLNKIEQKQIKSYGFGLSEDTTEIISHPILDLLNKPNKEDSACTFLYKIQLFLELSGDSFVLIERNDANIPISLHVLYSQFINIQTDGLNKVIAYNYGIARDGKYQYTFPPSEIIHFKNFDPNNILLGISPLEACARANALIKSQDCYEEALNRNLGVPSSIIKYNNGVKIRGDAKEQIEAQWQRSFASVGRAGKVLVTDDDVTYTPLTTNSPREMNWTEGRKWCRETILASFGINPAILLTENVNRSNMEQAEINYYNQTIKPRLKLLSQTLTNQLLTGISKNDIFLVIWKDEPKDSELLEKEIKLLSEIGALTVNEIRTAYGWDVIEGGDERPIKKQEVMPSEKTN